MVTTLGFTLSSRGSTVTKGSAPIEYLILPHTCSVGGESVGTVDCANVVGSKYPAPSKHREGIDENFRKRISIRTPSLPVRWGGLLAVIEFWGQGSFF